MKKKIGFYQKYISKLRKLVENEEIDEDGMEQLSDDGEDQGEDEAGEDQEDGGQDQQ